MCLILKNTIICFFIQKRQHLNKPHLPTFRADHFIILVFEIHFLFYVCLYFKYMESNYFVISISNSLLQVFYISNNLKFNPKIL